MEIRLTQRVSAPPERVMKALTSPVLLTRWCCEAVDLTPDTYRLMGRSLPLGEMGGPLLVMGEGELSFEWVMGESTTTVHLLVEAGEEPAQTAISVVHTAIAEGALPGAAWESGTWQTFWLLFLTQLRAWVHTGEPLPTFDFRADLAGVGERELVMPAPPEEVWEAIMAPVKRGRFQLAGERSALLSADPPAAASFRWQQYRPCKVTVNLAPLPEGRTRVQLAEESMPEGGLDHHLGWHLFLVALRADLSDRTRSLSAKGS